MQKLGQYWMQINTYALLSLRASHNGFDPDSPEMSSLQWLVHIVVEFVVQMNKLSD
jgi:hypothetical protein